MALVPFCIWLASVAGGLFLVFFPRAVIQMQIRFYARINWRMEPISMAHEIRATRFMGLMVLTASLLVLFPWWRR